VNVLCVIPVRGGSKGVPGKNARVVAGKPLLAWTVEQALAATEDLDVLVSTDDAELARLAVAAGADVPFLRPAELGRDDTPTEPAVLHAIAHRTAQCRRPDAVLLLQATSPVRLPGTLDRALAQFGDTGVDTLVGVVVQSPFLWRQGDSATATYDVRRRPRRQELGPGDVLYRETGSLYVTRTEVYEREHNRIGGRTGLFVMDEVEGIDIDTLVDLRIAERLLDDFASSQSHALTPHGAER
jgi:N-acylneuraminate cytidylyltransferase